MCLTRFCLVIHHFFAVVTTIVYNYCVVVCYSSLRSQNCRIVYGNICCFVVPKEALEHTISLSKVRPDRNEPHLKINLFRKKSTSLFLHPLTIKTSSIRLKFTRLFSENWLRKNLFLTEPVLLFHFLVANNSVKLLPERIWTWNQSWKKKLSSLELWLFDPSFLKSNN